MARGTCHRGPRRNDAVVFPQVTSGVGPGSAQRVCRARVNNDPLNKTDPLGLFPFNPYDPDPNDDEFDISELCPDNFMQVDDLGHPCRIGDIYKPGDEAFPYTGRQPLAMYCAHSTIPLPKGDIADLQDGDIDVDCTVILSRKTTVSLNALMKLERSRTRVVEQMCGERDISLEGRDPIRIPRELIQTQLDQAMAELKKNVKGVETSCVPFIKEANGSLSENLTRAVEDGGCLGLRLRLEGVDFDWGSTGAPEGWEALEVANLWLGSFIIRYRRDLVTEDGFCFG